MFCKSCGETLNEGQKHCPACGAEVVADSVTVEAAGAVPFAGKDKTTILLLCIFLGGFGVHNFIMGETKKGIAKIIGYFLCGIPGFVLWVMDLIKIIKGDYVVDTEKWF